MHSDSTDVNELANFARQVGAQVLQGDLHRPSATGGWQLGDVDLAEYLDIYRDQPLMLVLVPLGAAKKETFTCGVCGYVMDEPQECPRCKFLAEYTTSIERGIQERKQLVEQVAASLSNGE
jgi:rubrerythrin